MPLAVPVLVRVTVTVLEVEGVVLTVTVWDTVLVEDFDTLLEGVMEALEEREGVTLGEADTLGESPRPREGLAVVVARPVAVRVGEAVVVAVRVRVPVVRGEADCTREPEAPTLPEVVFELVGLGVMLTVLLALTLSVPVPVKLPEEVCDCVGRVEVVVECEVEGVGLPLKLHL